MILIWKLSMKLQQTVIVIILFLSLIFTSGIVPIDSSAKFYWLPFRAWELLLGVIAMYISKNSPYC